MNTVVIVDWLTNHYTDPRKSPWKFYWFKYAVNLLNLRAGMGWGQSAAGTVGNGDDIGGYGRRWGQISSLCSPLIYTTLCIVNT